MMINSVINAKLELDISLFIFVVLYITLRQSNYLVYMYYFNSENTP